MKSATLFIIINAWVISLTGCEMHNVKFVSNSTITHSPVESASVIHGSIDDAVALLEQAALPHNSTRVRFSLQQQAIESLTSQLGSKEYAIIGEVYGGGNAHTNMDSLRAALAKRAAAAGGDVVLVFRTGVDNRPFVYSTPGYATTTAQYSAYGSGGYARGTGTSYTTYTPGTTYAGVMQLPYANGIVLKHVPGIAARRQRAAALNDSQLEQFMDEIAALEQRRGITYDDFVQRYMDVLVSIEGQTNP